MLTGRPRTLAPASWAPEIVVFTMLGVLVVAPWTRGGWLLLLDWTAGPRMTLANVAFGLDGAQADAMPLRAVLALTRRLVGAQAASWLPILAVFPVAAVGVGRLVGGSAWRRLPAALLFTVNPFVLHRLEAGHVPFLIGCALLPWAVASFLRARHDERWFRVRSAAWLALLTTVSPHLFWIGALALVSTVAWRPAKRDVLRVGLTLVAAGAVSTYGVLLYLAGVHVTQVGPRDLQAFATGGGSPFGRLAAVATLQGFWRAGVPRMDVTVVLVASFAGAVIVAGARAAWHSNHREAATTLAVAGVAGLVLAGGAGGVLGPLYELAVSHVPFFPVMREAQKWAVLPALAFAAGFGFGAEALAVRARRLPSPAVAALTAVAAAPLVLAPSMVWGLGGRVAVTDYPVSWAEAEAVMGSGPEAVLFLPWHQYQPLSFTSGRSVRTPAAAYFSRPVITADAVELAAMRTSTTSRRSAYLDRLMARAGTVRHLGRQLAPLGVSYVVVAGAQPAWLSKQVDLELLLQRDDLAVFRSTVTGTGRVSGAVSVASIDDAIDLVEAGGADDTALVLDPTSPPGAVVARSEPGASGGLATPTPARFDLASGARGVAVVPTVAHGGWQLHGRSGWPTAQGVLAFPVPAESVTVTYRPWRWVGLGYALSGAVLVALVVLGLVEHQRSLLSAFRNHRTEHPSSRLLRA
jgi:hypothetical protein